MALKGVFFLITATCLMSYSTSSARDIPSQSQFPGLLNLTQAGLQAGGQALDCLNALNKIRSCSSEILAYFASGTIDITPPCCEAITLITHHCWPVILRTLGYSPDQANILRGYCDASAVFYDASFGPGPSPVGQPIPAAYN